MYDIIFFLLLLSTALSQSRSEKERNGIVDELFSRYAKTVSENPDDHGMDYVHAYLLIKKI